MGVCAAEADGVCSLPAAFRSIWPGGCATGQSCSKARRERTKTATCSAGYCFGRPGLAGAGTRRSISFGTTETTTCTTRSSSGRGRCCRLASASGGHGEPLPKIAVVFDCNAWECAAAEKPDKHRNNVLRHLLRHFQSAKARLKCVRRSALRPPPLTR